MSLTPSAIFHEMLGKLRSSTSNADGARIVWSAWYGSQNGIIPACEYDTLLKIHAQMYAESNHRAPTQMELFT